MPTGVSSWCFFQYVIWGKKIPQILQLCGSSLVCIVNESLQLIHLHHFTNTRLLACVDSHMLFQFRRMTESFPCCSVCRFFTCRLSSHHKALPHVLQVCSFSSVWILMCLFKSDIWENLFPLSVFSCGSSSDLYVWNISHKFRNYTASHLCGFPYAS